MVIIIHIADANNGGGGCDYNWLWWWYGGLESIVVVVVVMVVHGWDVDVNGKDADDDGCKEDGGGDIDEYDAHDSGMFEV